MSIRPSDPGTLKASYSRSSRPTSGWSTTLRPKDGGHRRDDLEDAQQARPADLVVGEWTPSAPSAVGQHLEMRALGRAEPQGVGDRVERDVGGQHAALLEPAQVVHTDVGEHRHLFATQARHPASRRRVEPDVGRPDTVAPRA
jgi:hypothetical protein